MASTDWRSGRSGWPGDSGGPAQLLGLRVELADRHAELGARFQHPRARFHQRQVLVVGEVDQAVERRVAERRPPALIVLAVRLDSRETGVLPAGLDRRLRRDEIRPDRAGGKWKGQGQRQQSATATQRLRDPGPAPGRPIHRRPRGHQNAVEDERVRLWRLTSEVQAYTAASRNHATGSPTSTSNITPRKTWLTTHECAEPYRQSHNWATVV